MSQGYGGDDEYYGDHTCLICGSTDFSVVAGSLACAVCGTLAQDYEQIQGEYQPSQSQRLRRVRQKKAPAPAVQEPPPGGQAQAGTSGEVPGEALVVGESKGLKHLKTIQALLQRQVDAAIAALKCQDTLMEVVRRIWFGLLDHSDNLTKLNEINRRGASDPGDLSAMESLSTGVASDFPLHRTVTMIMLGALILREPVMPVDLTRAILSAELPYTKDAHAVRGLVGMTNDLLKDAVRLSRRLSLPHPKINVGGLVMRILDRIGLPMKIALHVHRVHASIKGEVEAYFRVSEMTDGISGGGITRQGSPYPFVFALVVVTLKLLYGLDGRKGDEMPVDSWLVWAKKVTRAEERRDNTWLSDRTKSMPIENLEEYLDFLDRHLMAEGEADLTRYIQKELKVVKILGGRAEAPMEASSSSEEEGEGPPVGQRWETKPEGSYDLYNEWSQSLHVDYQAVVIAMSSAFWIKPAFVHHAVIALERILVQRESQQARA